MKALFICSKSPYPPVDGGALAMYNMITGVIHKGITVKLLCISTPKFPVELKKIPEDFRIQTTFEHVQINSNPRPFSAFLNLFNKQSYHIERFTSSDFCIAIERILKNDTFDTIQLEGLYVTQYIAHIRKLSNAPIVYRAHNIEHLIWKRVADTEKNIIKKAYLKLQASRLKKYEVKLIKNVDAVAAITATDASFFKLHQTRAPVCSVPFGINKPDKDYSNVVREIPSVFFLGSLNWIPNTDGLKWFLEHVWPAVNKQLSTLKLYIAGRHAPEWLLKLKMENVIVDGEVEDALAYMHSKMIMVVPLFSGSGMRIKIIEGMFAANTVISTTLGAEGIDCTHAKDILIADSAEDFANRIIECVNNPDYAQNIALQARKSIYFHYMNEQIMNKVLQLYHDVSK